MGHTTVFRERFELDRPLAPEHAAYLSRFADTRRMKRAQIMLNDLPDPLRTGVGLPLGRQGGYFVAGEAANDPLEDWEGDPSVVDDSEPPVGQPGLWCDWVPTADLSGIEWNGREKFYRYEAWLNYLIMHFLKPWGYTLHGRVAWRGQDRGRKGEIHVAHNRILDFNPIMEAEDQGDENNDRLPL